MLFLFSLASTWALVGLIWTVQIVVYPQFRRVSSGDFKTYHRAHTRRIGWIVAPAMLVQLASSLGLLVFSPGWLDRWIIWAGVVCVVLCWLSTAFIQVPLHNRLATEYNGSAAKKLIISNWIRTVAWSIHGLLLLCGLAQGLGAG